jgi:type I restriction enzyme R subunit
MELLKNEGLQELLVNYPRPERTFVRAYEQTDNVSSILMLRDVAGNEYKPADYLKVFSQFVAENPDHIDAVRILLDRPRAWSPTALTELREKLARSRYRFSVDNLQRAHEATYRKALVDVISMVKHAAKDDEPLFTASERVERAFEKVTTGKTFTDDQQRWLDRIREHLRANLSIDQEDFEVIPIFADAGGWGVARRAFGETKLEALLHEFNEAIAA